MENVIALVVTNISRSSMELHIYINIYANGPEPILLQIHIDSCFDIKRLST